MKAPALDLWRRELAGGRRTVQTFDSVWRAACAEANAVECEHATPNLAAHYSADALEIIRKAAKQQRGSAA